MMTIIAIERVLLAEWKTLQAALAQIDRALLRSPEDVTLQQVEDAHLLHAATILKVAGAAGIKLPKVAETHAPLRTSPAALQ